MLFIDLIHGYNVLHILKNTIIINIMEHKINKFLKNIYEFNPLRACCGMPLRYIYIVILLILLKLPNIYYLEADESVNI